MIEFQLLDIWSKFHHKVTVSYYTQSCTCTKESCDTEHSIHGAEGGGLLEAESPSYGICRVASHTSCLG